MSRRQLRKEYIATIKMNLRNQLDNIDIKEADGTIVNLGEKYGRKQDSLENRFLQPGRQCADEQVEEWSRHADRARDPRFRNFCQADRVSWLMQITIMRS